MLNQIVVVGRIVRDPEVIKAESGKKYTNLTLAVPRSYKNINGEYDTDFVPFKLWEGIAENTCEYCKCGDLIGIKGHVETDTYEKDNEKHYAMNLVAEKVTFLSSCKSKEADEK